ncbi:hypothetical protein M011DRAFT_289162 [Sporormia fimetaria CBS 119925]|uniref:Transcription elongation factor Eaf N-terminal domain-containing protein n=1 Tax=Sporormia fimetaria CBS 119925 TaxID=1340428 RepID=A0A6A6UZI3_9PLEO|nr:hypothetical protein M011DRAFT_289162 [Sporormia fimetaria CBS 119925]
MMASPLMDGRSVNPREKAHFSLHISDRIARGSNSGESFTSIKYNHKPPQTSTVRTTTLTPAAPNRYNLTIHDENPNPNNSSDIFTFTGEKAPASKKSYTLLFDHTSQQATLEPLDSTYTFNLATKNRIDVSSAHPQIALDVPADDARNVAVDNDRPDPNNPFDVRHFLISTEKEKRGDESEYGAASSPDYRALNGNTRATSSIPGKRQAPAEAPPRLNKTSTKPRKRKSPAPEEAARKTSSKKAQATPQVRLERRASTYPKPEAPKASAKKNSKAAAQAASQKYKSAEIVHSSEESDVDVDADAEDLEPVYEEITTRSPEAQHTGSSFNRHYEDQDEDEDDDDERTPRSSVLEIEDPDTHSRHVRHSTLASLGSNSGLGLSQLRSPSAGPLSLASVANSLAGSPDPRRKADEDGVIDFGNLGRGRGEDGDSEDEEMDEEFVEGDVDMVDADADGDRDVEPMDLGPPAEEQSTAAGGGAKNAPVALGVDEDEDEDPLLREMIQGLAGDSSEESEEE